MLPAGCPTGERRSCVRWWVSISRVSAWIIVMWRRPHRAGGLAAVPNELAICVRDAEARRLEKRSWLGLQDFVVDERLWRGTGGHGLDASRHLDETVTKPLPAAEMGPVVARVPGASLIDSASHPPADERSLR